MVRAFLCVIVIVGLLADMGHSRGGGHGGHGSSHSGRVHSSSDGHSDRFWPFSRPSWLNFNWLFSDDTRMHPSSEHSSSRSKRSSSAIIERPEENFGEEIVANYLSRADDTTNSANPNNSSAVLDSSKTRKLPSILNWFSSR